MQAPSSSSSSTSPPSASSSPPAVAHANARYSGITSFSQPCRSIQPRTSSGSCGTAARRATRLDLPPAGRQAADAPPRLHGIVEQVLQRGAGDDAELVVARDGLDQRHVVAIARAAHQRDGELERLAVLRPAQHPAPEVGHAARGPRSRGPSASSASSSASTMPSSRAASYSAPVASGSPVAASLDQPGQRGAARPFARRPAVARDHPVQRARPPADRATVIRYLVGQRRRRPLPPGGDHVEDRRPASLEASSHPSPFRSDGRWAARPLRRFPARSGYVAARSGTVGI